MELPQVFTCGDMPYGRAKNPEVVERVQRGQILQRPSACPYEVYEVGSNRKMQLHSVSYIRYGL